MLVHWDDVEAYRRDIGRMRAEWTDLGAAAGSRDVGVRRIRLAPGEIPTPAHVHILEEEIFFVLDGSGRSWQGGATFEIRAGDCLVHRAGGAAHTLRAGSEGLDVLAFGHRTRAGGSYIPAGHVFWLDGTWTEAGTGPHPFEREPELAWPYYPRSGKVFLRGVGVVGRIEPLDYWEGEE